MTQAWYRVASLSFGYVSAAIIALIVLMAARGHLSNIRLWSRVRRNLPQAGAAGVLRVLSSKGRRLPAGQDIPVPYEGTLGSAMSCDVRIPARRVHLRSAFFWMERDALHMVALHRDGFLVDDVPVEPGDEAVLSDGAVLRVGEIKLVWRVSGVAALRGDEPEGPYVTPARRTSAQRGSGDGIGAPGRGEARREKRLREKQERLGDRKSDKKTDKKTDGKAEKADNGKKTARKTADKKAEGRTYTVKTARSPQKGEPAEPKGKAVKKAPRAKAAEKALDTAPRTKRRTRR